MLESNNLFNEIILFLELDSVDRESSYNLNVDRSAFIAVVGWADGIYSCVKAIDGSNICVSTYERGNLLEDLSYDDYFSDVNDFNRLWHSIKAGVKAFIHSYNIEYCLGDLIDALTVEDVLIDCEFEVVGDNQVIVYYSDDHYVTFNCFSDGTVSYETVIKGDIITQISGEALNSESAIGDIIYKSSSFVNSLMENPFVSALYG